MATGRVLVRSVRNPVGVIHCALRCIICPLWLYLSGTPYLVNRLTIVPRFWIQVILLTVWTHLFNTSFVVHRPGYPPCFIARASNTDVRTFTLTDDDVSHIYLHTSVNLRTYQTRIWGPAWHVCHHLQYAGYDYRQLSVKIDLTKCRLVGPHLVQGLGLVGHGVCIALVEEYGRWPGQPFAVAGKVFSWDIQHFSNIKFPAHFAAVPGVKETVDQEGVRITMEWQSMEDGISYGPRISATPLEDFTELKGILEPLFLGSSDADSCVLPPDFI